MLCIVLTIYRPGARCAGSAVFFQIPRDIDHRDTLVTSEQEHRLQCLWTIVVEQVKVPPALHEFRDQYGEMSIRVPLLQFQNMVHNRTDNEPKMRVNGLPNPLNADRVWGNGKRTGDL